MFFYKIGFKKRNADGFAAGTRLNCIVLREQDV